MAIPFHPNYPTPMTSHPRIPLQTISGTYCCNLRFGNSTIYCGRFARLLYIDDEDEAVHVQWFDHSSKTILEQLGQPQELLLTTHCDTVPIKMIVGKVEAHYIAPGQSLAEVKPHDFFYRYINIQLVRSCSYFVF